MSNIIKLTGTAFITILLIACGDSSKEGKGSLNDKKVELTKLKADQSKLGDQIKKLEEEIGKLDSTTVVQAKLVAVTTLATQNFAHYIDLRGEVSAEDISYIAPRGMGGQVKALYIKQGDVVRRGQVVLKLDDAIASQQVASARQQTEGVKVQLELAKDLYKRQKNLWEQGIGTEVQLLNAKNAVDGLENQLKLANEGIKLAQEQLNQSTVISDVSGVADIVNIKVGEMFQGATAAGPQIRIVNNSRLKAVVQVPENYIASIKKGTPVVIEVTDVNKTFNSTISFVGQTINSSSRAITAEAKIPSDPSLKPNQLATVKIRDYSASNALVIPMTTIQNDEKGKYVFVMVSEKGKQIAKKKMITVGEIYGEQIEVKSGLNAGEVLITQGYQGIYDGQTVTTQG
jgi:membrane fusion protein, multidrug efflux system